MDGAGILVLLALLLLLPCCGAGFAFVLRKPPSVCPHCKECFDSCRNGVLTVTLESNMALTKDMDANGLALSVLAEEMRQDICWALQLTDPQVSVNLLNSNGRVTRYRVHLIAEKAGRALEEQMDEFDRDRLDSLMSDGKHCAQEKGMFWPSPHVAKVGDTQQKSAASVPVEKLVEELLKQSADEESQLKRGKQTRHIRDVQHDKHGRTCDQCQQDCHGCTCRCLCCGEPKQGCPAKCQRYCTHCAAPKHLCNSGDVKVVLDLDPESL